MSSLNRCFAMLLACALSLVATRSGALAQQPPTGNTQPPAPASQPAASLPVSRIPSLAGTIKNVQIIAADLRQSFEKGQVTASSDDPSRPDNRMGILALLVRDKLPYMVNKRVEDQAAREAIQADLKAAGDYIDHELVPACNKARQSKDPADAKALVPLLDGLTARVAKVDETAKRLAGQALGPGTNGQPASQGPGAQPTPGAMPATGAPPAPGVPPARGYAAIPAAPPPPPAPPDPWTQYVQQFIATYRLDNAQQAQAGSILQELEGRAGEYRGAHKFDYEAAAQIEDKTRRTARGQALDKPLSEMFEELKTRLMTLPTETQRNEVGPGKTSTAGRSSPAAASRPAPR